MMAGGCIAAGFADFALIAYHFQKTASVPAPIVPIYYAVAMGVGAIGALAFGKLFDKIGVPILVAAFALSAFFAPLVFLGKMWIALLGMILWGIGMGAQESLLKSVVAGLVSVNKRGTAFGVFDTGFGIAWFAGSWLMGILYGKSITAVIIFSVALQLLSLPIFLFAKRTERL